MSDRFVSTNDKDSLNGSANGSPPEPIRFGVVGLGYWGPNLLRALSDLQGVEVSWICDVNVARLERFGRRFPAARCTTDVEDLIADDALDAMVIATPVYTHFELASRALRAGKHTFVEKPLAPSTEAAHKLVDLAEDAERVLMCGHTFVYSSPVRTVKRLLDSGELGEVFFVTSSRVNLGLHQRDVSVIWDLAPHDFSILLFWLEEMPVSVRAVGRDSVVPGVADVAFVSLTYASGIIANVELSWLAPSKLRRTVVVGSEKMVIYDDSIAAEPVRIFDRGVVYKDPETFGEYQLSYRTGDILSPTVESYEPIARELEDFTRAVRTGSETLAGGRLATDVVRLTEAADESLRRGGAEVQLQTPELLSSMGPTQLGSMAGDRLV